MAGYHQVTPAFHLGGQTKGFSIFDADDFTVKEEVVNRRRTGKGEVLNREETGEILGELNQFFENWVEVKRIRNVEHQTLETLINEEAQLFEVPPGRAKSWVPSS